MDRGVRKAVAGLLLAAAVVVFYAGSAAAYPLPGTQLPTVETPSSTVFLNFDWAGIFHNVSVPLQVFINNVIGSSIISTGLSGVAGRLTADNNTAPSTSSGGGSMAALGGYFGQWTTVNGVLTSIGNLFSGIFGFPVTSLIGSIIGVIVWVLTLAKNIISWLLSVIH